MHRAIGKVATGDVDAKSAVISSKMGDPENLTTLPVASDPMVRGFPGSKCLDSGLCVLILGRIGIIQSRLNI